MSDMKALYLLVPLAPLAGAILAGLFGKQIGRAGAHVVTILGVAIAFVASLFIYQDVAAMKQAVGKINPGVQGFEASCFDSLYITGDISDEEVTALNEGRQRGGEDDEEDTSRLSLPNAQE